VLRRFNTLVFVVIAFMFGLLLSRLQNRSTVLPLAPQATNTLAAVAQAPTETIPPSTPLSTLTPSRTLKPPPTFEPPTITVEPSLTPTITPTATIDLSVSIPGLNGAETATPASTAGCEARKDWKLTYTIQRDDALSRIADLYNTSVDELVKGNCLKDKNVIVIGQVLKVPGKAQPVIPEVQCIPFELQTPRNGTLAVEGGGSLSIVWHGPRSPYNLIRIMKPDGGKFEVVVELRQNETINLTDDLPAAGTYTWYIIPLNSNFVQTCPEGGPWIFTKAQYVTQTPQPTNAGGPTGP
jgi:LysM repeat protein